VGGHQGFVGVLTFTSLAVEIAQGLGADVHNPASVHEPVAKHVRVVNSRAFFLFFPCNHIINIKKKSYSGEVKDSVNILFFFNFTKALNLTYTPP
jgi:hypothetical protein